MTEKNQAIIEYLLTCPSFVTSSLFFNYAEGEDGANQFIKIADDTKKKYIDGSELKTYTFNIISYKSIANTAIISEYSDENMEDLAEAQDIITWVNEQNDMRNFPDFGENCVIDEIKCLTNDPDLFGVDTSVDPPLAKYSIAIRIEYLDTTKSFK